MDISKFLHSSEAKIIISIVLGLGLATCFRYSCKNGRCIVIKGPKIKEVEKNIYRIDENCFKYTPYVVDCKDKEKEERVSS
jgi:hypothetical protein